MKTLPERLRDRYMDSKNMLPCALEHEAAAEIDRLRERVKVLAESRDCRTCKKASERMNGGFGCLVVGQCTNADRYDPLPAVQLWRTK